MSAKKLDDKYLALIRQFPLVPIRTKEQHVHAVAVLKDLSRPIRLASLSDAEEDYLDVLGELVVRYEKHQYKQLAKPMTPLESLKYLLDQSGVTQSELARQCGARQSHISEFLAGNRDLSKDNIVRIAKFFKVSPELFLKL